MSFLSLKSTFSHWPRIRVSRATPTELGTYDTETQSRGVEELSVKWELLPGDGVLTNMFHALLGGSLPIIKFELLDLKRMQNKSKPFQTPQNLFDGQPANKAGSLPPIGNRGNLGK